MLYIFVNYTINIYRELGKRNRNKKSPSSFFPKNSVVVGGSHVVGLQKIGDDRVKRNEKQSQIYFRLESKLAQKLDRRIERAGYTSRSEFFTAVAYVVLYGMESKKGTQNARDSETVSKLPETVITWIHAALPRITEEEILAGLHEVIAEMLTPVIAMKGVDIAFDATWEDVRLAFHERSGVWVTESDVREAYDSFAVVKRGELERYRERQMREDTEE